MSLLEALFLGVVQGLTEFLPVSSSGHLVLFQKIFGLKEAVLTFDVVVHLGTLLGVIIFFRREVWEMIKRPCSKFTLLVVAGAVPTAVIGLGFKDFFEKIFASGKTLGVEFIATGIVLWLAERVRGGHKKAEGMTYLDAAFVGLMQGVAILPAISRSGLTIAGALFRGLERDFAARYSFVLSIPVILGAGLLDLKDVLHGPAPAIPGGALLLGFVAAAVSGVMAIKIMMRVLNRGSMKGFAYYTWALGVGIILAQLFLGF